MIKTLTPAPGKPVTAAPPSETRPVEDRQSVTASGKVDASPTEESLKSEPSETVAADVSKDVERLESVAQSIRRTLKFAVDEDTGRTVITVLDSETNEIIRQIPPGEIKSVANRLEMNGSLIAERA